MTRKRFSLAVENLVNTNAHMSYIEAAVMLIEERGMEYTNLKRLLTDSLKAKMEDEAHTLNLLRGAAPNKLPI